MPNLYVAAGGGGDALAASIINRAMGHGQPSVIATYAWDRLVVDPRPGPRSPTDFDGLTALGRHGHLITSATRPKPPSGSTLPRLAGDVDDTLALLDPTAGVAGLHDQLVDLVAHYRPDAVLIVDVGGDALARGNEAGLRSPLADGLTLAASTGLNAPVEVCIAGPGVDGELTAGEVLAVTGTTPTFRLTSDDVEPFRNVIDWHPSEATALLAAAAVNLRGRVEIRDKGLAVVLTDVSPNVYSVPLAEALEVNQLAHELVGSASLDDAEAITRKVCGFSEIDYERSKASRVRHSDTDRTLDDYDDDVRAFERAAAGRGADYVTFRRIAEAISLPPALVPGLRQHLVTAYPDGYAWPLWLVAHP